MPLRLDDMNFIFADNNTVATEDTTIAKLIKSGSEGVTTYTASSTGCDNGGYAK